MIAGAAERHAKNLWSRRLEGGKPQLVCCEDEDEQTEFVVRRILEHREAGVPLRRQAVLFRASHHSLALELELARRNIPFHKYGGLRFVETAHVKDLLAFLRLAENPRDLMAGTRVLMLLPGVGPKKARGLMNDRPPGRRARRHRPPMSGAATAARAAAPPARSGRAFSGFAAWAGRPAPSAAAASAWEGLVSLMTSIGSRDPGISPPRSNGSGSSMRLFSSACTTMPAPASSTSSNSRDWQPASPDRARFLAEIALDPPSYTEDLAGPPLLDEDFLILSTIHSAKGLEWDSVYVIHAADGNIPSDMATGQAGGDRGGAQALLRRFDSRQRLALRLLSAPVLHLSADVQRRPRLRAVDPLPAGKRAPAFEETQAAGITSADESSDDAFPHAPGTEQAVTTEDIRRRLKGLF